MPLRNVAIPSCVLSDMPFDFAFSAIWSRIFTFRPKIYRKDGQLIARSDWRSQFFSLGFAGRQVVVDRTRELIRIRKRTLWIARSTRFIPFKAVEAVTYDYHDVDPSGGWAWSHQQDDLFLVGLRLQGGERLLLFRFYGSGDFVNDGPFPDWFYWEDILTAKVTMQNTEGESRAFAGSIAAVVGVDVEGSEP